MELILGMAIHTETREPLAYIVNTNNRLLFACPRDLLRARLSTGLHGKPIHPAVRPGLYQDALGEVYKVFGTAAHTETGDALVIYEDRSLAAFACPAAGFRSAMKRVAW